MMWIASCVDETDYKRKETNAMQGWLVDDLVNHFREFGIYPVATWCH